MILSIQELIINSCSQVKKDRFAILDAERNPNLGDLAPKQDTKYAALYTPWIYVYDVLTNDKKLIPPSGHIAGIYARSDNERGVHKSPVNEIVAGVLDLQQEIEKGKQDVLNPKGVNVIRKFPGRGNVVWGARTMSKYPLWKYISVPKIIYLH